MASSTSRMDALIKETNQVKPSDVYITADRTQAVKLRIGTEGISAAEPLSVPGLLSQTAELYPDQVALCHKDDADNWQSITYRYYFWRILWSINNNSISPHK